MQNTNLSPEQKKIVVAALQDKIDYLRKEISEHQLIIKQYNGDLADAGSIPLKTHRKTSGRDGGWIAKIDAVLSNTEIPLTSRQILDLIYDTFPEFTKDDTHMGSLSSALKSNSGDGKLYNRIKVSGEFAKFELNIKDLL
jgi:hypothetical protein